MIGIGGQMRMGKDTVGDIIAARTGMSKRAFAAAVKTLTSDLFKIPPSDIEGWKCNPENPPGMVVNMRTALQMVGDGMRQISPSVWIDKAMDVPSGIFCDVRYSNEAQAIRNNGGFTILVGRSACLNDASNASEAHLRPVISWFLSNTSKTIVRVSELDGNEIPQGASDFDWFVRNDTSLEALDLAIDALLTEQSGIK